MKLEELVAKAKETLLRDGHHDTIAILEGSKGIAVAKIVIDMPSGKQRENAVYNAGRAIARANALGRLTQAFFISEGWSAVLPDGDRSKLPESLEDAPNRKEVLFVVHRVIGEKAMMHIYEMIRSEGGELIDLLARKDPDETRPYLLDALIRGYKRGGW